MIMKTVFLSILAFISLSAFAQKSRVEKLDSIFASLFATGKFSGNVLIAENGKQLYKKSFGLADESTGRPINSNTQSLLGSVSKQFTPFAIVLMQRRGKLSLDDTLRHFLPSLLYQNITVRQLLNQSSGIPDYIALMNRLWDNTKYASNKDVVDMLIQYHPDSFFPPGTMYGYSNTGYALLASIIEKVSGKPYAEFMEQEVFAPLGMKRTIVYARRYHPRLVTDYALGYVYDDSLHSYVLPDSSVKFKKLLWEDGVMGEDGVNSTVGDLLKWDQVQYNNPLLDSTAINQIFSPGRVAQGQNDYGFGWHIKSFDGYGKIAWHSGGWPGYMAYIERHLQTNKIIIILRNKFSPELKIPIDAIRNILYNQSTNTHQ
jgi:CubicO group peptidase (beta-lactamase class C family)